jgi:hypothetical protein
MEVGPHAALMADGSLSRPGEQDGRSSRLLLDVPARRGYQVMWWAPSIGTDQAPRTEITEFDLNSLTALRRVELAGIAPADADTNDSGTAARTTFPAALAPASSGDPRLFFIADMVSSRPGIGGHDLVVVDLRSLQISADIPLHAVTQQCVSPNLATEQCPTFGLAYDPASRLLYAATADGEANLGGLGAGQQSWQLSIRAVNLTSQTYTSASLPSSCDAPLTGGVGLDPVPIYRSPDGATLWTACGTGSLTSANSGVVAAAVAIALVPTTGLPDPNGTPRVIAVSGQSFDGFADPSGNRMSFLNTVNGDHNLVVLDGAHSAVVGSAGLDPDIVYTSNGATHNSYSSVNDGIDPATGRVYHASERGMYVIDSRRTDRQGFPQGTTEPLDGVGKYAYAPIAVDYLTRHVFVLEAYDQILGPQLGGPAEPHPTLDTSYTIYQDNVPVSGDVPLSGIDSNTGNLPLVAGSTVAIYSGHAQGFGSRLFTVNPSYIGGSAGQGTGPAGGTRDVLEGAASTVAGTGGADLTNGSASASGLTLDADDQSRQSYTSSTQQPFPYAQQSCDDSSGTASTGGKADPGGSTQESCDLTKGIASVVSAYRASDTAQPGLPATSPAESDVTSTVTYLPGQSTAVGAVPAVVSTSTATVHGIQLAADVSVSYLQITATSVAGGRAGTASTKVTLTIRGVKAGAFDCPVNCDPGQALQQINSALQVDFPNQATVTFPSLDAAAAAGTPKGYFAAVYKDTYQYLNDATIDYDSRSELVGMEEIRNNDSVFIGSTARQITDYGGVEVESRFGITALDLSNPTVGTGAITAGTSIAGSAGTAGQFAPGSNGGTGTSSAQGSGAAAGSRSSATGPLAGVINGLAWLLDWTQLPLMSLMWIVLLLPAYLATRRQRLGVLAL